jgi:hypothetical protein
MQINIQYFLKFIYGFHLFHIKLNEGNISFIS